MAVGRPNEIVIRGRGKVLEALEEMDSNCILYLLAELKILLVTKKDFHNTIYNQFKFL